jgi:hypothetical protein
MVVCIMVVLVVIGKSTHETMVVSMVVRVGS